MKFDLLVLGNWWVRCSLVSWFLVYYCVVLMVCRWLVLLVSVLVVLMFVVRVMVMIISVIIILISVKLCVGNFMRMGLLGMFGMVIGYWC